MTCKDTIRRCYEAFARGDMETIASLTHDDYVATINGSMPISGEHHGFDNFAAKVLAKINGLWPGFSLEPELMIQEGDSVFVTCHATTDNGIDTHFGHLWHLKDGKIDSFYAFDDTQAMADSMLDLDA